MQAKAQDPETIDLINSAAAGMIEEVETNGAEALQDWEVDELLEWTTSLNFDE